MQRRIFYKCASCIPHIKPGRILFVKLNKFQFSLLLKVPIFTFLIRKIFHGDL